MVHKGNRLDHLRVEQSTQLSKQENQGDFEIRQSGLPQIVEYAVVKAFTQGEGKGEISPSQNLSLALET